MSRSDGFDRADVSTSLLDDPKFRILARRRPELYLAAIAAYLGLLTLSWREGERLTLEEGWPTLAAFDSETARLMAEVGLVDEEGRLPAAAWGRWFGVAFERRQLGRDRQKRADRSRGRGAKPFDKESEPTASTGSTDRQSDRQSVSQSGPSLDEAKSSDGPAMDHVKLYANGRTKLRVPTEGACRDCGGFLTDKEPARVGPGWIEHAVHPVAVAAS